MTEQNLEEIGFERTDVSAEESGGSAFYYYTIDIGDICLISNSSDDAEIEGWWISIFDSITLKLRGIGDVEQIISILKLNTMNI
jgi:hypothetical protein